MSFVERLEIALALTIAGSEHPIPSGNVKRVSLALTSYGFEGRAAFYLTDDTAQGGPYRDALLEAFTGSDLIEVTLDVKVRGATEGETSTLSRVTGIVRTRALEEESLEETSELPVLWRRYEVEFADAASVLWGQHFPCELFTQKSMKDVLTSYGSARVSLDFQWPPLESVRPQLFVHLPASSGVSFYDFVLDYVARRAGQFVYEHGTSKYALRATKPSGTAVKAFGDDLGRVRRVFPEVRRTTPRLMNTSTEDPRTLAQQAPLAVTPFRHDELTRTPLAQSLDAASRTLESTLTQRGVEVELEFVRVPAVSYVPGTLVSFESARRFGQRGALEGETLRVFELRLDAQALRADADADRGAPSAAYRVSLEVRLEAQDDTTARLPAHRAPAYPGYVEGKIVSHVGTDTERTYDFVADQDTSLKYYEVTLPVFASQTVRVPFEPHHLSGNVYIPAYRDARVLLAYWLEDARVERLLDWREGVPLAKDSQGEQLLFGRSATSQTSVNHVYEDAKPVFNVVRKNEADRASIRLQEGSLVITVQEVQG